MERYSNGIDMACRGILPDMELTIPEFLTPEKILQIRAKLIKKQAENMKKLFEPIDEEGRYFWEDQERVFSFISSGRVDLAINDEE